MDELINRQRVELMTGLSRSTIYRMLSEGSFPKPLKVGRRATRWRLSIIVAWVDQLPEKLLFIFGGNVFYLLGRNRENEPRQDYPTFAQQPA